MAPDTESARLHAQLARSALMASAGLRANLRWIWRWALLWFHLRTRMAVIVAAYYTGMAGCFALVVLVLVPLHIVCRIADLVAWVTRRR